ncbi:hypothetical protein ES703_69694 [subsurface metagenome]
MIAVPPHTPAEVEEELFRKLQDGRYLVSNRFCGMIMSQVKTEHDSLR